MSKSENLNQILKPIDLPNDQSQLSNSKPKDPLYKCVFWEANCFSDNYLMIKEGIEIKKENDWYSPMLMSLAFSNELFFKCLILLENSEVYYYSEMSKKEIKGHKISELFSKIKINFKTQILNEFSSRLELPEIDEEIFKQILINQNCDNSFIEWRYTFEIEKPKTINYHILEHLNYILKWTAFKQIQKLDEQTTIANKL